MTSSPSPPKIVSSPAPPVMTSSPMLPKIAPPASLSVKLLFSSVTFVPCAKIPVLPPSGWVKVLSVIVVSSPRERRGVA